MALRLIDGVPGSGKTYYAVNHLLEKYRDKLDSVVILANIESLMIPHIDLQELVEKNGGERVFCDEWIRQEIAKNPSKHHVMIIDEAQRFFHKKFFNNDVFFFFQYHRHYGLDIYIITQNEKLIPLQITSMSEYTIHAQPRSVSIFGELKYVVKVAGENVERVVLKPKQDVFDLYKSQKKLEGERPKNVFKKYFIWMALLIIAVPIVFFFTFLYHPKKEANANEVSSTKSENVSTQANGHVEKKKETIHEENAKTMSYVCGVIVLPDKILIEDPFLNVMVDSKLYEYPLKLRKYGYTVHAVGYFPRDRLEKLLEKRAKSSDQRLTGGSGASHERASDRTGGY